MAPPSTPAARSALPTEAVLAAFADLIRLEDRRAYEAPTLERHAAAASAVVRARAALALGRLRRPQGAPTLLRLLADPDTSVAATAAFALGQLADSTHVAALAAQLTEEARAGRGTVASEAAYAFGKIGGSAARDALLTLLASEAVTAPTDIQTLGSALLAVWKLSRPADLSPVSRWLAAVDPELRWRAAYALSRRTDARAFPLLRQALSDPDARVRSLVLRGLIAPLADSAGVPRATIVTEILPSLRDPEYIVAVNAARTLGGYAEAQAIEALAVAARSPAHHLAIAALESLGRIGTAMRTTTGDAAGASAIAAAVPGIAAAARSDSLPVAVRAAALDALAAIDSIVAPGVAEALAGSASWRLRAAAGRAFALSEAPGGTRFGALLRDADPRVANATLQAAVDAAGDSLLPLRPILVEQLGAGDVIIRATSLTALSRIAEPALLPTLLDAYARAQGDTLNDAALAAVDAIAAIEREGTRPGRAFFARFDRSADALVRQRVAERFDSTTAETAWGAPFPIDTGRSPADYRRLVNDLIAPALAGVQRPTVALVTGGDTIQLRLFPLAATLTVESFLNLADAGYFDGQQWPRVVGNFVVQGGDPRGDTSGGPGYSIRDEINRQRYGIGTLGMALAGPDTGGSQFFITHSPQPHLDGTYAVFGEVVAGVAMTEKILPADTINRIRRMP